MIGGDMDRGYLEFSDHSSPSAVKESIDRYGVALIRRAVDEATAARYLWVLDELYRRDRAGEVTGLPDNERAALDRGDVWPNAFNRFTGLEFGAYFDTPLIRSVVRQSLFRPRPDNQTILTVSGLSGAANAGLGMHTDGIVQGTRDAVIALWSPLHPCGVDAPGLSIVPAPLGAVVSYLRRAFPDKEIPGWCSHSEWGAAFEPADLAREFGTAWSPAMEPGDAIVFTNWTIHGSYVQPAMRGKRSAIVQRWVSDSWRRPTLFQKGASLLRRAIT
jgi:hypothetical protein